MTTTSHKDLLFTTFQEFDTAQQRANRARSDMHCIIATLPNGEKPEEIVSPLAPGDRLTVVCPQNNGNRKTQTPHSLPETDRDNRQNRPVIVASPQPEVVGSQQSLKPPARRISPLEKKARIQEALLYCAANPHLTQQQVAVHHGLEPRALSRHYAKKLKKSMAPNRDKTPKNVADDFIYNEKRHKQK